MPMTSPFIGAGAGGAVFGGGDADDLPVAVEQGAAGVARVDGGVSLNERDKLIAWEVTALSRDDTARDCVL